MIEVRHLTKRFPGVIAVDDLSFDVRRGEIVGFLGPNGAGKTTTLRILCGYLPATAGEVRVAGYDVFRDSLEVRRRLGYLPENCPLYPEMRVIEYLRFRARLKGLSGRRMRERVEAVMRLCGLDGAGRRLIGELSKGFRQRVGLADALVHEPELLILDEPTLGLDPNQIREVRRLIRDLAERHTILLSTHILQEVEMTCRRVLIIHRGRLVAADTPDNLRALREGGPRIIVEISGPAAEVGAGLGALPHVRSVRAIGQEESWVRYELEGVRHVDLRPQVFELAARRGWTLRELRLERRSLEDVFARLTEGGGEPLAPPAEEEPS